MAHIDWYDLFDTLFNAYRVPIDRTSSTISGATEPTVFLYKTGILCSLQPYTKGINDRVDVMYDRRNYKHYFTLFCDVEDYLPQETDIIEAVVNAQTKVFKILAISNQINTNEVQKINLEWQPDYTFKIS